MFPQFRHSIAAAALVAALPTLAPAQTLVGREEAIYTWRGTLASGGVLTMKNYNGPIDVRPSTGSAVEFRAEKHIERGGSIQDVAFEVNTHGSAGDVTICAVLRTHNPCDENRWGDNNDDDRDRSHVTVSITLMVPKGANVRVVTGNGALSVEHVSGDLQATTGNGRVHVLGTDGSVRVTTGNGDVDVKDAKSSVRVTTGNGRVSVGTVEGPVEAHTGNGDIDVAMTALRANQDMAFTSGSGDVRVTLPAGYNGELDATTGNGELSSDFDLKISGRMNPHRVHATIGTGGPRLRLTTGNGRLELRKG